MCCFLQGGMGNQGMMFGGSGGGGNQSGGGGGGSTTTQVSIPKDVSTPSVAPCSSSCL